ncbi:Lipid-A-disaccharide synthase [hydrothermal vent metagenome]|uniref:lipid-A-disaccharide synthase n=1 Tax=hydrothermal vent metagenome TaxID=652676 RepID=A0A3B1DQG1_9ZZZZ
MENSPKHIIIIAGETSGDMHGAHLVKELKTLNPTLTFSGLGGPNMQQNGVTLYEDLTKLAVVGFLEILKHYGQFKKIFRNILFQIKKSKPSAIILVDYPGFNLRLAKKIKKNKTLKDIKIIYYISPQVWAWKKKRVFDIKKYVDKMLVLFPFEKDFYTKYGVDATYVGHPLLDTIQINTPKSKFLEHQNLFDYRITLGLLPGSRQKEVEKLLPIMLGVIDILRKDFPMMQFLIIKAPNIEQQFIERSITNPSLFIRIVEQEGYDALNACDLCIVASGTATLETAILQKPMIIIYKTSLITWMLAKIFVKIPNIGLANIIAGKQIVPECIQFQAKAPNVAEKLKSMFTNEIKLAEIKQELRKVKKILGESGASKRAAEKILEVLENKN